MSNAVISHSENGITPTHSFGPLSVVGYATPYDAFTKGKRETLIYVACITPMPHIRKQPDYLATVDVDPDSPTYSQVVHRTYLTNLGDEIHHFGWNICSSCHGKEGIRRNKIILPGLGSDRVYILNVDDERKPFIQKIIEPEEVHAMGLSSLHTTHCLPTGEIMISAMGDVEGNGKGDFLVINEATLSVTGTWTNGRVAKFGYDFWYQPYFDILIASEWGAPKSFKCGFNLNDTKNPDLYGQYLNIYSYSKRTLTQTLDLGEMGIAPLEIRMLHDPKSYQGFVGCALNSKIFRFFRKSDGLWDTELVIDVQPKLVAGWVSSELSGMITDILISMDDKYLYFSNWLHGDVRQYDISNPTRPQLVGRIFLGGKLLSDSNLIVLKDPEHIPYDILPQPSFVKGRRLFGGPQMLQLSLDGKRLYVTTSLYSPWDNQIYPETVEHGSTMVMLHVDNEKGGLHLDNNFLIDFGKEPRGPVLAHEMRYPGGDCTSDIFLPTEYLNCKHST